MDTKKQQMNTIHQMCQKEVIEMQMRIQQYMKDSEFVKKILEERFAAVAALISPPDRRGVDMVAIVGFDRYMSQLTTIYNMARKFSIYLQLNNLNTTVFHSAEPNMELSGLQTRLLDDLLQQPAFCESRDSNGTGEPFPKREVLNMKGNSKQSAKFQFSCVDIYLSTILPQKDLSYLTEGSTFSAIITFIKDCIDLEFFICQMKDYRKLFEISSSLDIKPIDKSSMSNVIFGVSQDKETTIQGNHLTWRAVKYPEDSNGSQDSILLIDLGEVIQITESCQTYSISAAYREYPPLAVRCILKGACGLGDVVTTDRDKCKELLLSNRYKVTKFRVLRQESRVLHVVLVTEEKIGSAENPARTKEQNNNLLGSSRYGEHIIAEEKKDLSVSIYNGLYPKVLSKQDCNPQIGDHFNVTVTHVSGPITFYAIIGDTIDNFSPSEEILSPPKLNDILLAQHSRDDRWYRAQVIEILPNKKLYRVFYIDIGNEYIVKLSSLALYKHDTLHKPPQAIPFRLANLKLILPKDTTNESYKGDECGINKISQKLKQATESMVVIIHNQTLEVIVVECRGTELIVQIIDDTYAYIPSLLINMGVVEVI